MDGLATLSNDLAGNLWMVVLAAAVAVHVVAVARAILRRRTAPGQSLAAREAASRLTVKPAAATSDKICEQAQIDRLFTFIAHSAHAVERMTQAHASAAVHLDSAEYQLQRLFDEFPMLAVARTVQPAPSRVVRPASPALATALAA